jgi:hypothetical protein
MPIANRGLIVLAIVLLVASMGAHLAAAPIDRALKEADGRRQAAENGVRDIKAKSEGPAEYVRSAYEEAASRNNAWLETTCQAVQTGPASALDMTASADAAATALIQWVAARNRALGLAELSTAVGDSLKKQIVQDLGEITRSTWRSARSANEAKRAKTAAGLKERLQWRMWDEIK